jgi:hypothetical protein
VSELEQVTELCRRLGAEPAQAATMAAQLLKRADQIAQERGIERVAAMKYLLGLLVKGRSGETVPEFPATKPPGA